MLGMIGAKRLEQPGIIGRKGGFLSKLVLQWLLERAIIVTLFFVCGVYNGLYDYNESIIGLYRGG